MTESVDIAPSRLLTVRHQSPLRIVSGAEVLSAFSELELRLPRSEILVDSRKLDEDVEGGHWRSSDEFVRETATALRTAVASEAGSEVHYFGIVEVPHLLGVGAYFGDETLIHGHDYHRDLNSWKWPSENRTLEMVLSGIPGETVSQSGEAVLIVEVSYPIAQSDVDAVIGDETLATIRIRPDGHDPAPGIVRSWQDVMGVRSTVRSALAAIAQHRPGARTIHLFIAAPVSVCLSVGQELRLRNGADVQTYRFRADDPKERYKRALLLTARGLTDAERVLSEEDRALAAELRTVLRDALEDVRAHAARIPRRGPWFASLKPTEQLRDIRPFASLTALSTVVAEDDLFSDVSRDRDYAFPKEQPRAWELSDRIVLSFYQGAGSDRARMRQLARLFFYHEYLHDWQDLTKYTAEDVGSFANCLEAIDYMADTYAILHQLDFAIHEEGLQGEKEQRRFLVDQIELVIASFWAFEPPPPNDEWQERRLRRYLNWYWRRVQLRDAPDLRTALRTLARRPSIEIAGFKYRTGGGRIFVRMNELRPGDIPEIGLLLEDGRFTRRGTTTDLAIQDVMAAFGRHDHYAIDRFFSSLFEHTKQTDAVWNAEPSRDSNG